MNKFFRLSMIVCPTEDHFLCHMIVIEKLYKPATSGVGRIFSRLREYSYFTDDYKGFKWNQLPFKITHNMYISTLRSLQ